MKLVDLDTDTTRLSSYITYALEQLGATLLADNAVLKASAGDDEMEIWLATDVGLVLLRHKQERRMDEARSQLTIERVTPWTAVAAAQISATITRSADQFATELSATIEERKFATAYGRGVEETNGLAGFVRAVVRRLASL